MPAKSKAQHGFMGMVLAYKRGEMKESEIPASIRNKVKQAAATMKESEVEEFTSTKAKKLPKRIGKGQRSKIRKVRSS